MFNPSAVYSDPPADVYHSGVQKAWCNPNGINDLSITPNNSELVPNGIEFIHVPNFSKKIPKIGQIIRKKNPISGTVKNVIIGTNLDPEKNPSTGGIWNVWNLLYKNDTNNPIVIPPNTDVCIDVIPTLDPTTDAGTS